MKNRFLFLSIGVMLTSIIFTLTPACKKKDKTPEEIMPAQNVPELSAGSTNSVSQTKMLYLGNVTGEGSSPVTARGVCWNTLPNPTLADKKTLSGSGVGSFEVQLRALKANTKYYIRAYATNSFGTGYGSELSFTTQKDADGTVTDADGNVYHVITIGTQKWLKESLKTLTYNNGDSIKPWSEERVGGYCYLGNADINANSFGAMYNWYAATDPRQIAPAGWHVPSLAEWQKLIDFVGGENVAGGKLKETGNAHWNAPNMATDDFGFSAQGGGYRVETGDFFGLGYVVYFWSTTNENGTAARIVGVGNSATSMDQTIFYKRTAHYVRCIMD